MNFEIVSYKLYSINMKLQIKQTQKLSGVIKVSGAKNAALKMIAASILIDGKVVLDNTPYITDVIKMSEIVEAIGGKVAWSGNKLTIDTSDVKESLLPVRLSKSLRGSVVFVGPLLSRLKKVVLPWPGGCAIGKRPLTTHVDLFRDLGVTVKQYNQRYEFKISSRPPKEVSLDERSVTATENAIMYLAKSDYKVTLKNVAAEPEIDDLIDMLNNAGARIKRISSSSIDIVGVDSLHSVKHKIIGDRIEAGTWIVAGLLLGDKLKITGFDPEHLKLPIDILKKIGGDIKISNDSVIVKKSKLSATDIKTAVYPGFPTDLQSPFGLLLTQANGKSTIDETLFNDRLRYLEELNNMGAQTITETQNKAIINGPTKLVGRRIESTDLRAGATMVLAGLIADGETTVEKAEIIDRGYEKIDSKLSKVGASIKRIE